MNGNNRREPLVEQLLSFSPDQSWKTRGGGLFAGRMVCKFNAMGAPSVGGLLTFLTTLVGRSSVAGPFANVMAVSFA
jgi:hypothetical protein